MLVMSVDNGVSVLLPISFYVGTSSLGGNVSALICLLKVLSTWKPMANMRENY